MSARSDEYYMARAIALAESGIGRTSPNPAVGCVIVRDGEVVGEGYHPGPGLPHAEVFALEAAGSDAHGATVYVTLEPCSTQGRTPPCTDALLDAGVSRVVYGTLDPNPDHHEKGVAALEVAGIATTQAGDVAVLREMNRGFFTWMEKGRPYVSAKVATTLDGRVTLVDKERSKLSGRTSDAWTHRLRAASDAVLVGIGTVLADDPLLTARPPEGAPRQPARVVIDSRGRLPLDSQLVGTAGSVPLVVVTTAAHDPAWRSAIEEAGGSVVVVGSREGKVDLLEAARALGEAGILEVAAECGPTLLGALLKSQIVDAVHLLITPWIGGDASAPRWYEHIVRGSETACDVWPIERTQRLGEDVLITLRTA